jgi:hypothetical protein
MHKPKVHVKAPPAVLCAYRRTLSGLFANPSLFLKVDEPEWMVFKCGGQASDVTGEGVELVNTRGTKTEEPHF